MEPSPKNSKFPTEKDAGAVMKSDRISNQASLSQLKKQSTIV